MTDEAAKIAAGLSEAMQKALLHENAGGCAYRWASIGTLEALQVRGLVKRIFHRGALFSPQTNVDWRLTEKGLAVRAHLERQSDD